MGAPVTCDVRSASLEGEHPLAARVVAAARAAGVTLGTAESCTGGLVAAALTSVPGSSEVVAGGAVTYQVPVKERVLGVEESAVEERGVVSVEVAAQMARGARALLGCTYAVSTTGVAGPGGGSSDTPVGCVCFAVDGLGKTTSCRRELGAGTRAEVRARAVDEALRLLLEALGE